MENKIHEESEYRQSTLNLSLANVEYEVEINTLKKSIEDNEKKIKQYLSKNRELEEAKAIIDTQKK